MSRRALLTTLVMCSISLGVGVLIGNRFEAEVAEDVTRESSPETLEPVPSTVADDLRVEVDDLQRRNRELTAALAPAEAMARAGSSPTDPSSADDGASDLMVSLSDGDWSQPTLSPEDIERVLEAEGRAPGFLLVAAELTKDEELARSYIEEALEKAPDSPIVLARAASWYLGRDEPPERLDDVVDQLREVDPTNAFGSYLSASRLFGAGEPERALEALAEAGTRSQFDTYGMTSVETAEQFYTQSGHSLVAARLASTFGARADYLLPLRDLSRSLIRHLDALDGPERETQTLALLQQGNRLGQQMSLGGRTLLDDLVGISVQTRTLEREREIRERNGDESRVGWIEEHLENNRRYKEEVRRLVDELPNIVANMTEQDMLDYLSSVARNGEAVALREYLSNHRDD